MAEIWDLYDKDRRPTEETLERGQPVPAGRFYLVADVIVTSGDRVLITRRHPDKPAGGMWEFTGGCCVRGETTLTGIVREIWEEIGLITAPSELCFLGTMRRRASFVDDYLLRRDFSLSDLRLQPSEVTDARFVSPWELDRLCTERVIMPSVAARWYRYRPVVIDALGLRL